ncbi:MAG: inorganic diphosphatase [bacterium]
MLAGGKKDDKLIAVHVNDPAFSDYVDVAQLPRHVLKEISRFFTDYKALENKKVEVEEFNGRDTANTVLRDALALYRTEEHKLRGWG